MDIWLLSDKCLSYSTGLGDFESNDHGKGVVENLWFNFRCPPGKKKNITFPLSSKNFAFYFLFLIGNPYIMQKNFELYIHVDFQHIQEGPFSEGDIQKFCYSPVLLLQPPHPICHYSQKHFSDMNTSFKPGG